MSQNTPEAEATTVRGMYPERSSKANQGKWAVLAIIVILGGVLIASWLRRIDILQFLKDLFMLKYFPQLGSDVSYGLLFILGVLTSVHCVGMCGGIVLSQTIENGKDKAWLIPSSLYNMGRIGAYTLVGGVVVGLGQVIGFTGIWKGLVPVFGGVFMVIMGINLLGIFPALRRLNIRMPYFAAKKIKGKNNYGPLYIGLLTGLMPCGPLQIVQLYALGTRSVVYGALSMLVFSLGTVPLLFGLGAVNTVINKKHAGRVLKFSAVFVITLGFLMLGRGFALSGVHMPVHMNSVMSVSSDAGLAHIEGNVQKVETSIRSDSFPPIVVQKGIPVKWTIHVKAENLNECNKAITIPKFKLDKKLLEGANLVEFTPMEEGDIVYMCWMGMIKSRIHVVGDLKKVGGNAMIQPIRDKLADGVCATDSQRALSIHGNQSNIPDRSNYQSSSIANAFDAKEPAVHPTIAPTPKSQDNPKDVKKISAKQWTGFLIDRHCFGLVDPEMETKACLTMEDCEASGYGIAVKQQGGQYKFYLFDSNGHKLAKDFLDRLDRNTGFAILITGELKDGVIKVSALSGK